MRAGRYHEEGDVARPWREHHVAKVDEGGAAVEARVEEGVFDVGVAVRERERRPQALTDDPAVAAA